MIERPGLSHWGFIACAMAAACSAATWPHLPTAVEAVTAPDFPAAMLGAATLACAALSAWILVIAAATLGRITVPGVPRVVRAALFTGVVVAAAATPAHADPGHDLDGLPLPDRPVVSTAATMPADGVTVQRGDTLWAIAADRLGPRASNARIATATRAWHEANTEVVGPDPDLIVPGQRLRPPAGEERE